MNAKSILPAGIIILAIAMLAVAAGASAGDIRFYAKGDPVYVSGNAPGAETSGLSAWIFGTNYWTFEYFDTEAGGSYIYEVDGGLTGTLNPGTYIIVIQHPMYNGEFDVTPQAGFPSAGQTSAVSTAGESFIIDGKGKLQGSAAAYALMNLLDSQNIDDTYTYTTISLEEPWIRGDDPGGNPAGSVINIYGTTNIAPGEKLVYTLEPASGDIPSPKDSRTTAYTTEMAGQTTVEYGMPYNTWSVDIDTAGMDPGTYIFTIEIVPGGSIVQKFITLYETPAPTPVSTRSPEMTVKPGESPNIQTGSPPSETPATETAASPLTVFFAMSAAAAACIPGKYLRHK